MVTPLEPCVALVICSALPLYVTNLACWGSTELSYRGMLGGEAEYACVPSLTQSAMCRGKGGC